ncbi:MAG: MotA/TolQ/ExbB proton channel family protein [Desulfobacterales bacterium]
MELITFFKSIPIQNLTIGYISIQILLFVIVFLKYLTPLISRSFQLSNEYKRLKKILQKDEKLEEAAKKIRPLLFKDVKWARSQFEYFVSAWRDARSHGEEKAMISVRFKDFMTSEITIDDAANQRTSEAMSGVLLALGIFGTFLGLVFGLVGVKSGGSIAQMTTGVEGLIESLSLAFITSLFGIFSSILFSILHKHYVRQVEAVVFKLNNGLATIFPCQTAELLSRRYIDTQEDIKHGIQTLATDIATKVADSIAPAMGDAVSTHLAPIMENVSNLLSSNIDQLKGMYKQLTAHIENIEEKQSDAIQGVITEYMDKLSGNLEQSIESVSGIIKETTDAQVTIREEMIRFGEQMQQQFEVQGKLIEKTSKAGEILSDSMESLSDIAKELKASANDILTAAELLAESAKQAKEGHETLSDIIEKQIEAMQTTKENLEEAWQNITENMSFVTNQIQGLLDSLAESLGEHLVGALESFDSKIAEVAERFSGTLFEANDIIEELPSLISDLNQNTALIVEGVKGQTVVINNLLETTENIIAPNIDRVADASTTMDSTVKTVKTNLESAEKLLVGFDDRIQLILQKVDEKLAQAEKIYSSDPKDAQEFSESKLYEEHITKLIETLSTVSTTTTEINEGLSKYFVGLNTAIKDLSKKALPIQMIDRNPPAAPKKETPPEPVKESPEKPAAIKKKTALDPDKKSPEEPIEDKRIAVNTSSEEAKTFRPTDASTTEKPPKKGFFNFWR